MRQRILIAAGALCVAAQASYADTHSLAKAGSWDAFGGTTQSGRPVCGMSSNTDNFYFGVKFYGGDNTVTIQLGGQALKIRDGAKQKLTMLFDGKPPWNGTGTGMHFNDGDAGLEYEIKRAELDRFLSDFRGSSQLTVTLAGSNVPNWNTSLAGIQAVSDAFNSCVRDLPKS